MVLTGKSMHIASGNVVLWTQILLSWRLNDSIFTVLVLLFVLVLMLVLKHEVLVLVLKIQILASSMHSTTVTQTLQRSFVRA